MLNHIVIMGRLTADPTLRRTGNGTAVTSFTVACERDMAPQGQEKETDFIECVAWRNTAEFVEKFFTKGRMIVVVGRLQIRKYTDKDGNKRTAAEVVADHCYFGDSKREDGNQGGYSAPAPGYGGGSYGGNQGGFGGNSYGQHSGGYGGGYAAPGNFAMMDDDDAQIPF